MNFEFPLNYSIFSFLQSNLKLQYRGEKQATAVFNPATAQMAVSEFLTNGSLLTYIFENTYKKVAIITQTVVSSGEFPMIPDASTLQFAADIHVLLIENGVLKYPSTTIKAFTIGNAAHGERFWAADFAGTKCTRAVPIVTPGNWEFAEKMSPLTYVIVADSCVQFVCLTNSIRTYDGFQPLYFKSGSFVGLSESV